MRTNFESINNTIQDILSRFYKAYDAESLSSLISFVDFCNARGFTDNEIPNLSRIQCIVGALVY